MRKKSEGLLTSEKYREAAKKRDGRLLRFINLGYDLMHLTMGYDGDRNKKVCETGFERANAIIDHCEKLLPKVVCA